MVSDDRSYTDHYFELLKNENHLLSTRPSCNGKKDSLLDKGEVSREVTEDENTSETESEESEAEDWPVGPTKDYLEYVQVRKGIHPTFKKLQIIGSMS